MPETSDRDRKESQIAAGQLTVGDHHAFALQGWGEVARETLRANQAFVTSVFHLFCAPIF